MLFAMQKKFTKTCSSILLVNFTIYLPIYFDKILNTNLNILVFKFSSWLINDIIPCIYISLQIELIFLFKHDNPNDDLNHIVY
jgi:hypothetical protein